MTLDEAKDYLYATLKVLTKNTDEEIRAYIEMLETESPKMTIAELEKEIAKLKVENNGKERTMKVDLDEMADRVAKKALDEFTYNGKTIREWVELMVTVESVVELRMVEEFEKIKAEIGKCSDYIITNHNNTEADMNKLDGIILAITIIDTEITELKGKSKKECSTCKSDNSHENCLGCIEYGHWELKGEKNE